MSDKVAELRAMMAQDDESSWIVDKWTTFNNQRSTFIDECLELRDYVFATDTRKTSNALLPWKNSTTLPKLCQIRDNLHSNYVSTLFPNDDWLRWTGYDREGATADKAKAIQAYMSNKTREGGFRQEVSKLLYDYIDWGNAFAAPSFEANYSTNIDGSLSPDFIGPKAVRISPLDIVFNPLASSFKDTFKIVRSVKTIGELKKLATMGPEGAFWAAVVDNREKMYRAMTGYSIEDFNKAVGYSIDGFGNLLEYYQSPYVEILEFYGDYHDPQTGRLETNRLITVVNRSTTVRNVPQPSWFGHSPIYHVGWRMRPDNLWAMSPLANLVGMQYRIDHLENLKADAMDLVVHPPLAITGQVEGSVWGPGAEFFLDEGGSIGEITKSLSGIIGASNEIQVLEDKMELFAGAPREAMGVRTPGEKTALEVQTLNNAAGRIFQEKITAFETELLEPLLNAMLESARRNMDATDVIRVMDDDLGVDDFLSVTKDDITASGKLRPIGARHFAKQAQDLQNIIGVFQSRIGDIILPHTSAKNLAKFVNDITGLDGYNIFKPNVGVMEQKETQSMVNVANEDLAVEQSVNTEGL